jgi:3-hydroxyisobutyrate dehydrogenase-like beta-hydroxyacid dehydrogenase
MIPAMSQRIAFLGLGIMGSRMAANLFKAGFELTVWNRTQARAEEFCAIHKEAQLAHTPGEAAANAEVVVTMVVDGLQVRSLLLEEDGAARTANEGTLFIDCSTIGPSATRSIASELAERGQRMLDAPVTGSSPRAEDGTLTIMVGGEAEDFARAKPVFEAMGKLIIHAGPLGDGQMVKLINNAVAASNCAVLAQALVVGARAGVDLEALTQVMGAGSGASTMLDLKARPMREHDYTTLFKLDHMLKDVDLSLQEADSLGVPFPLARMTRDILAAAAERGYGEQDFAAMIEVIESDAGSGRNSAPAADVGP